MDVVMLPVAAKEQTKAEPDPSYASLQPYRDEIVAFLLASYGHTNLIVPWHIDSAVKQARPKVPRNPLAGQQISPFERMPHEMLDQILAWCGPLDLLALSRTSHILRDHLTSRSSQGLWMASIACAYDRTSPAYSKIALEMVALGMTPLHFLQAIRFRQCLICGSSFASASAIPVSVWLCIVCKGSHHPPHAREVVFPDKAPEALSKHEKMVLNGLHWDVDKQSQSLPPFLWSRGEVHAPAYAAYLSRCKAVLKHFGLNKRQLLVALKKKAQAEIVLHKELYESIYKLTSMRRQPYFRYGTGM